MKIWAADPGSTSTGWALLDVRGGGGRLAITATYVSCGNVASKRRDVDRLLAAEHPDVVAVEKIEGFAFGAGKGGGVVAALIASSAIAGGVAWLAEQRGLRVIEMSARQWRGMVCGNPSAPDRLIKLHIERLIHGWPKSGTAGNNVHTRDAGGVGLAAAWHLNGRVGT